MDGESLGALVSALHSIFSDPSTSANVNFIHVATAINRMGKYRKTQRPGDREPEHLRYATENLIEAGFKTAAKQDPRGAANICYGIAAGRLNEVYPKAAELMTVLVDRALKDFKPQEIANSVWAFATLKISHPDFFARAAKEIERRNLEGFDGQNVGNTVWAFAAMGLVRGGRWWLLPSSRMH